MRKLIRKGECNRCMMCCGFGSSNQCDHLDVENRRCKVWRVGQPNRCKIYPTHPLFISQHWECSFKFYDAETGEEITKKAWKTEQGLWCCDMALLESYAEIIEEC